MESLKENGFVILKNVFSETELVKIREFSNSLIDLGKQTIDNPLDQYYFKHRYDNGVLYDVFQRHPEFQSFATNKVILDEIEKGLGSSFYLYVNSFLYKPHDKSNEVPFHQDFLSRGDESEKLIAWISFDHATKENGCLKIIPSSHKNGFREWYTVDGETHHDRIKISDEELKKAIYVELNPGDVLIFNNCLIHASDQNNSPKPRRAFRVVYKALNKAEIPRSTPLMLRGGGADFLKENYMISTIQEKKISDSKEKVEVNKSKKNFVQKVCHKVGKKLLSI